MSTPSTLWVQDGVVTRPYHHGHLEQALVAAGTELARETGPDGVVLREATRRVGVSATAAYRHFADREALLGAVSAVALEQLARAMDDALARVPSRPGGRSRAVTRLKATGRAYVGFALAQPGLFRTAFACPVPGAPADPVPGRAFGILSTALDGLVTSGALPPQRRPGAEVAAWAAVHGLSLLLLDGVLLPADADPSPLVEQTLQMVLTGL